MHFLSTAAAAPQNFTDTTTGKATFLVLTAILGFVSALALEQIKRRRDPHKQLSWDMSIEQGLVAVSPTVKERVQVLYENRPTDNLHAVRFKVSNTGNQVIKDQYIRFEFDAQTKILDHRIDPAAPREIGVAEASLPEYGPNEVRYAIKHIEHGQDVNFAFTIAGDHAEPPTLYPFNPEGDVDFTRRDAAKDRADTEHIRPFLIGLIIFIFVPYILSPLAGSISTDAAIGLLRIILAIPVAPHIAPAARIIQRIIVKSLADTQESLRINTGVGSNVALFKEGSIMHGDITFQDPDREGNPD